MTGQARPEALEESIAQRAAQLFNIYIHDPLAPQAQEVNRLVADVTERQEALALENRKLLDAQRHLEAYRDLYIDLYDLAPLGYATLDEDGYVQEINLAGAKMLGVDRESLTGQDFGDYVAAEDRETFQKHVRRCTKGLREATCESRLVSKNNVSFTVQLHSLPIVRGEDSFCKTAFTDITQRRDMEETLRRSQRFLQTVIDSIPDVLLVIGRDYRIVLANRAARETAPAVEPTCLTCHRFSHHSEVPCEGQREPCPLREVIASKAPVTVTHTHFGRQEERISVEITAAPVLNEAGEVSHIIETCRDITARKLAEEALEHERDLLHTLIDNLPDYIYFKDAQSRFVAANLATVRIMGALAADDLVGKTDYDFYPPDLAEEYGADEERIVRTGEALINKDEPHRDRDGNPRVVMTTKVPIKTKDGKVAGLVGISRDVTERRQAEEEARQAQQRLLDIQQHQQELIKAELDKARAALERKIRLAALGQLSSSIAHELRTPLAGIGNVAYLLQRKIPQAEGEYHELLEMIRHEIKKANKIVTNCTAMSQGRSPLKAHIELSAVIDEARLQLEAPEGIKWRATFDHEPFLIYADAAQIEQVLHNLFLNAIQAFEGKGLIRVEASRADQFDLIRVSDDGPGVPRELQEQMFEPLVTGKQGGTGLGLAICKQIVEQHGGVIELLAGEGPGTSFQISLPIQQG